MDEFASKRIQKLSLLLLALLLIVGLIPATVSAASNPSVSYCTHVQIEKNFDMICTELGLNMTAAINVFARALARKQGMPFDLMINDDFFYSEADMERLRKSIASLEAGKGIVHKLIEADDE